MVTARLQDWTLGENTLKCLEERTDSLPILDLGTYLRAESCKAPLIFLLINGQWANCDDQSKSKCVLFPWALRVGSFPCSFTPPLWSFMEIRTFAMCSMGQIYCHYKSHCQLRMIIWLHTSSFTHIIAFNLSFTNFLWDRDSYPHSAERLSNWPSVPQPVQWQRGIQTHSHLTWEPALPKWTPWTDERRIRYMWKPK